MQKKWIITGADRNTGEDVELLVKAHTAADAEAAAVAEGVFVATCDPFQPKAAERTSEKPPRVSRKKREKPVPVAPTAPPAGGGDDNLTAIKGLVVRAPYWAEIARGEKTIEYRSWAVPKGYRGPLAICAAKEKTSGVFAGCAVCIVDLVDCICTAPKDFEWILKNPRVIKPVPIAGRLGLMDLKINLNFDVEWDE